MAKRLRIIALCSLMGLLFVSCSQPSVVGTWVEPARRGMFIARLTDGREIVLPVSMFPDIKHMSIKERNEWMILDDQYFTFEHMSRVYSIFDLLKVA